MKTSAPVTAAAAGTWQLGDLTVNRMGLGAMRLPQTGPGRRGRRSGSAAVGEPAAR